MASPKAIAVFLQDVDQIPLFVKAVGIQGAGIVRGVPGIGVGKADLPVADEAVALGEIDAVVLRGIEGALQPISVAERRRRGVLAF